MALKWVFSIINDYSLTIILLTLVIKLITMPLDLKQRTSQMKLSKLSSEVQGIQKRYANAPDQAQKKVQELYREKHVKPTAGCLPMVITMILLFAFFGSLRVIASEQSVGIILSGAVNGADTVTLPQWLWVHNFWQPDSGFAGCLPTASEFSSFLMQNSKTITPQSLLMLKNAGLIDFSGSAMTVTTAAYDKLTSSIVASNGLTGMGNGWFGLPILAGVSLFFNQWYMTKKNPNPQMEQQAGMNKMLLYFMPLFSVYICITSNAAFSVYWLISNIYAMALNFLVTAIFKKKDEKNKVLVR